MQLCKRLQGGVRHVSYYANTMKLPLHTTSSPLAGTEARRVLRAVKAGRAVTNDKALAFAHKITRSILVRGKQGEMVRKIRNA